jgi:hypothetical protein
MKARFAFVVLAACGGGGTSKPPVGNTGTPPAPAATVDPWQAITEGATFTFTSDGGGGAGSDAVTLTATVAKVETTGDGRIIHVEWVENGRPLEVGGPPGTFTIAGDTIRFVDEGIEFPLAREHHGADGREVSVHDDGTVCYTDGPAEGAGDCPDVCFADLCVDPNVGLLGGAGLWWPGYAAFQRSDLR